jgi:uncharacterized membrane protein HdeD (DUF308 family)
VIAVNFLIFEFQQKPYNMKENNWSAFAINGVIALLFGVLALTVPDTTILVFAKYFGLLVLVSGIILLVIGINNRRNNKPFTVLLIEAVAAIVIGLIIVFYTQQSLTLFVILIGLWAVIMGAVQLIVASQVKGNKTDRNILIFNGLFTLVLGVLIFSNPWESAHIFVTIAGLIAVVTGILLLYFAYRFKSAG